MANPILHNLGDKLFNRVVTDLDLSLKKVRSQKDKLILHQKCVSAIESQNLQVLSKKPKLTIKHPKVSSIMQEIDTGEMEVQTGILQSNSADMSDETSEYEPDLVASHS